MSSDFSRLARTIRGTSVGLVLGGGGARGCSHVGMIRAILEAGIPIDRVAGVSIGAFMGGLWCQERDVARMTVKARNFCTKMSQKWRMAIDLTYPYCSMMTGFGFNGLIEETFPETCIEDLWLPYFTITTDISESKMKVHESGSLWRYVRASMSLAGYMPPLCDPQDGHLLLDGGYTNNLPADIMKQKGAKHILAVDVGSLDEVDLHNYGDWLSGWKILWSRLNPFATTPRVLSGADVQNRLAYVSCIRQLEEVKKAEYVDYIRPPIDKYGTLQFDAFDEIRDIGFYHGRTYFAGLRKAGQLWFTNAGERRRHSSSLESLHRLSEVGNYTAGSYARFTDLAEMVCRVRGATPDRLADTDNDGWGEMDSDPDSEDIISDPDDYMEEDESGFLSQPSTRGEVMAMSPFDREDMLLGMGLPGMAPLGLATGSFKRDSPSTHTPSVHSSAHTPSVRSRAGSTQSSASRVNVPRRVGASFTSYNISGSLGGEERRRASCDSNRTTNTTRDLSG